MHNSEKSVGLKPAPKAPFWTALTPTARWLVLMVALQAFGSGLTGPFLMIYLHEVRNIDLATAGLLIMMIGIGGLAATGPCGVLIDRFGAWSVLLAGTVAMSLSSLVLAIATGPALASLSLVLAGVNLGVSLPARNVLIASTTVGRQRRTMYALSFALMNLSWGLGGVIGGLYLDVEKTATFVIVFVADAGVSALAAVTLLIPLRRLRRVRPQTATDEVGRSLFQVLRAPGVVRLCALTFLATFIGYGQLESGIPVFARAVSELSTRSVGFAFAVNTVLIGTLQLWVLHRIEGRRRTRVIVVFGLVWMAAWLLLASTGLVAGSSWAALGFLLFVVALAFGEMILMPLLPVIINDLASDQDRGRYNAIQAGALQLGMIAGPLVGGLVLHHEMNSLYIGLMVTGSAAVVVVARTWERTISAHVNGLEHTPHSTSGEQVAPVAQRPTG